MGTEHQLTSTLHSLQTTTMVDASNTNGSNGVVTDIVVNNDHPVDTSPSPNGKIPSSITRVYDIPVVKGTVDYADSLIRSLPLAGAAYVRLSPSPRPSTRRRASLFRRSCSLRLSSSMDWPTRLSTTSRARRLSSSRPSPMNSSPTPRTPPTRPTAPQRPTRTSSTTDSTRPS